MNKKELVDALEHVHDMTDVYVIVHLQPDHTGFQAPGEGLEGDSWNKVNITRVVSDDFRVTLLTETIGI